MNKWITGSLVAAGISAAFTPVGLAAFIAIIAAERIADRNREPDATDLMIQHCREMSEKLNVKTD